MSKKIEFEFTFLNEEELTQRFENILTLCTPEKSPSEISQIIHKQTINRFVFGQNLTKNIPNLELHRVTIPTFKGFNESKISSFSYPPKEVSKRGRANLENHPVFYCSLSQKTATMEMKDLLSKGVEFYISQWTLNFENPIFLHSLMYNSDTMNESGIRFSLAESVEEKISDFNTHLKGLPTKFNNSIVHMQKSFGNLFALSTEEYYHITSSYAHEILYNFGSRFSSTPIIMYPSVIHSEEGINFAIPTNAVDNGFITPKSILKCRYIGKDKLGEIKATLLAKGEVNGGKIQWTQINYKFKLNLKTLEVTTYNKEKLHGSEVAKLKLENSYLYVVDVIKDQVSKYLDNIGKNGVLDLTPNNNTTQLIEINFGHGKEIQTKKGKSCIQNIKLEIEYFINNF